MSTGRISTRYAKSLLDLSIERNELEAVRSDIESFAKLLENRDLYLMLKSPVIKGSTKIKVFKNLFEDRMNKTLFAFFRIIMVKGREMYLPEIIEEFLNQYKLYNKITSVRIVTATPLSDSALSEIKAKLLASDITMEKVDITTSVNSDILGGFILQTGDKLYDASVQHHLDQIKKQIILGKIA